MGWRLLINMGYIGVCGPKGNGFLAILVVIRVSILAILISNRVSVLHFCLETGMLLEEATFSSLLIRPSTKALHNAINISLKWETNGKKVQEAAGRSETGY